ncbi:MAG: hypothetical protein AB8G26_05440 [Ilumatobacter sp.]
MSALEGAARTVADEVLFPHAQRVDRSTVPREHLDALADAGLFDLAELTPSEMRRVVATIGGGCGATFFVWVQHHGVVRNLASSANDRLRDALLDDFRTGRRLAGVAFAHVRRPGAAAVRATRSAGSWRLDGHAPWATSWGLADRFCVAAVSDDDEMVWVMLPGHGAPGMTSTPLELSVFAATGTVALDFDSCQVDDTDVVAVSDVHDWRDGDRRRAAIGQPAVLGVAERAVRLLAGLGPEAGETAQRLSDEIVERWAIDDDMLTAAASTPMSVVDSADRAALETFVADASDHRAACLDIGRRATTALLAACGGAGMDLAHPAQRLARESTFYVIQAQTADGRSATLRSL